MTTTEENIFVGGCKTDHLYPRDFKNGSGRFFNYVIEEEGAKTIEYSPPFPSKNRIKLSLTFIYGSNEIKTITLKRFKHYKREGWVEDRFISDEPFQLSHFSFEKLASLLHLLKDLDLASLNQSRIPVIEGTTSGIDFDTAKKIRTLLIQPDGQEIVEELIRNGLITSHDIVNIGYRKAQLDQFRRMLDDPSAVRAYADHASVRPDQPEKAWQHFFPVQRVDIRPRSGLSISWHTSGRSGRRSVRCGRAGCAYYRFSRRGDQLHDAGRDQTPGHTFVWCGPRTS